MISPDQRLQHQLEQEIRVMDRLLGLIREEQTLLVEARIHDMGKVIEQKARHIADLAQLASQRHALLGESGCAAEEAGMQDYLARHPDAKLLGTWQKLIERVSAARGLNNTNGLMINTQLGRYRSALAILSGHNATLYGPDGQTNQAAIQQRKRGFVSG